MLNSQIAYGHRGILKHECLNNYAGALADYNEAIAHGYKSAKVYGNRAGLPHEAINPFFLSA